MPLRVDGETVTISTVGTQGRNTTLSAAAAAGATNIKVASVTGMAAGDPIVIDGESGTIQTVGTAGATGTGVTLDGSAGERARLRRRRPGSRDRRHVLAALTAAHAERRAGDRARHGHHDLRAAERRAGRGHRRARARRAR